MAIDFVAADGFSATGIVYVSGGSAIEHKVDVKVASTLTGLTDETNGATLHYSFRTAAASNVTASLTIGSAGLTAVNPTSGTMTVTYSEAVLGEAPFRATLTPATGTLNN